MLAVLGVAGLRWRPNGYVFMRGEVKACMLVLRLWQWLGTGYIAYHLISLTVGLWWYWSCPGRPCPLLCILVRPVCCHDLIILISNWCLPITHHFRKITLRNHLWTTHLPSHPNKAIHNTVMIWLSSYPIDICQLLTISKRLPFGTIFGQPIFPYIPTHRYTIPLRTSHSPYQVIKRCSASIAS